MTLGLNGQSMFFCIDTWAEITVISKKACTKIGSVDFKTLDKTLKVQVVINLFVRDTSWFTFRRVV